MLIAAGIYNLALGAFAIAFPTAMFRLIEMEPPKYLELRQCIGMIVGVYGVGYLIAAFPLDFVFKVPAVGQNRVLNNDRNTIANHTGLVFQICLFAI